MSNTELPKFTYHPDPLATGSVEASDKQCDCCERARGYIYSGGTYSRARPLSLCPWCISDGSAAAKFTAQFVQDVEGGRLDETDEFSPATDYVLEVLTRTPGYSSWQGEYWLCHCDDACEFHGDIGRQELKSLPPEVENEFVAQHPWFGDLLDLKNSYQPGGNPALYKFVCRHCGVVRLGVDMT